MPALVAEALGLGISSNETAAPRFSSGTSDRSSLVSIDDLDDGVILASGGIVQVLSNVFDWKPQLSDLTSTRCSLVASSESAIGNDGGGGVLTFLLSGLQSAVCKPILLRRHVVAPVRRSVRADVDSNTVIEASDEDHDEERAVVSKEKKTKYNVQTSP
jgi:hypothetical protein